MRARHLDLAGRPIGCLDDAAHPAEVVRTAAGVDRGSPWLLAAELLQREGQRGIGASGRQQRVDHDPAGFALDQVHIREVMAADLVSALGDSLQDRRAIESFHAPQAWPDGGGGLARDEA